MNILKISNKQFGMIVLIDIISVSFWAISIVLDTFSTGSINTLDEAFNHVSNQTFFFFLNYINGVIFTLTTTVLFVGFYLHFHMKTRSPWLLLGLIFVPIYSLMNLFAYGSQITIIPMLLPLLEVTEYQNVIKVVILMLTQVYPGTIVNTINLAAYGILAIPSIIFARELMKQLQRAKKISGIILGLNGISCIVSILALVLLILPLAMISSMFGGFLTLMSLIPLEIGLIREETSTISIS
ncbi:MAG: hypothetical protein ACXAC8_16015 [Candidatus Hodarchaeales archaeon]|jgi:hypothetical protein